MPRPGQVDRIRHGWMIFQDAFAGFWSNGGLRQASCLAFYTTLALIPALLLLTWILGLVTGESVSAHLKLTLYLSHMVPGQAERVLGEVAALTRHAGATAASIVIMRSGSATAAKSNTPTCSNVAPAQRAEVIARQQKKATTSPVATPQAPSFSPCRNTIHTTLRRLAPTAMRIPISRVRRLTE